MALIRINWPSWLNPAFGRINVKNLKDIPDIDKPREKMIAKGPEAMTDIELVALILGSGNKDVGVLDLSKRVISIYDEHSMPTVQDLTTIDGVGPAKACQLAAALEFSRRRLVKKSLVIRNAKDLYPLVAHISTKKQEHFLCLSLTGANEVIATRTITIGLLNSSQIHPREVFADAISDRAASVIFVHNHPSGVRDPSKDDILVTDRLCKAGEILGINVLDHVIIAGHDLFSFREQGMLPVSL
jgi:DNA repair protein RadC